MSCEKNTILAPNYEVTSQQVYSTPLGYTEAMAKVYGAFALTGNQGVAILPVLTKVPPTFSGCIGTRKNCLLMKPLLHGATRVCPICTK